LADVGDLLLAGTLLVLQVERGLLAHVEAFVEAFQRELLRFVFFGNAGEGLGQRVQVQARALGGQHAAAPVVVKRLAVEVVDARALDIGCARGLGGLAAVRVPTLLPVGQRGLGLAQGVLAGFVALAEGVQRGLGLGDRLLQDRQSFLVTADVLSQLGDRILGLFAGAQQALRQLALVGDLLLDTRQRAAHFVAGSLGAVERLHRVLALHTAFFKRALGLALLGDQLLQAGLFLRQPF